MYHIYGAHFLTVSLPEKGIDDEAIFQGDDYFGAPVMEIVEHLPANLIEDVAFTNAVDFAGSTSANFCSSRIRWVDHSGEVVRCDRDFDERDDLRRLYPHLSDQEVLKIAVENSQWVGHWRGQVSGAIRAMLTTLREVGFPSKYAQWRAGGPIFHEQSTWTDPSPLTELFAKLKRSFPIRGRGKLRVLVVLSVDAGPITQVEKTFIRDMISDAQSDLRRRHFPWMQRTRVLWCHFPTVADMLRSLDGDRNLVIDTNELHRFDTDCFDRSLTYTCERMLHTQSLALVIGNRRAHLSARRRSRRLEHTKSLAAAASWLQVIASSDQKPTNVPYLACADPLRR